MIRRVYVGLGIIAVPFALIGLRIYTKLTKRPRVRVFVTNEKDQILLLRGILSSGKWTLPGGGVNRRETLEAAARRELREETGIDVPESQLQYVTTLTKPEVAIPFDAPLFRALVKKSDLPTKLANPREIREVAWFDRKSLPKSLSLVVQAAMEHEAGRN